jgi:calcineurin-like phosphoesterase family protein
LINYHLRSLSTNQNVKQTNMLIQDLTASCILMINGSNPIKSQPYHSIMSHYQALILDQILLQLSHLTY